MNLATSWTLSLLCVAGACVSGGDRAHEAKDAKAAHEDTGVSAGADSASSEASAFFKFPDAYARGRSAWLRARFRRARAKLRKLDPPDEPKVVSKLHREPFTEGEWVQRLSEDQRHLRSVTESNAIESTAEFFVPGVSAQKVSLYLAAASYLEDLKDEGSIEQAIFIPPPDSPPEDLDALPKIREGDWFSRVNWRRSDPFAESTEACYVKTSIREGGVLAIIEELWANCGGPECGVIRMSSTQYAAIDRDGGAVVLILAFYSGQTVPVLTGGIAESSSSEYHRKVLDLVRKQAGSWKAPPHVLGFFRRHGELAE